jgi:hypothetical protein
MQDADADVTAGPSGSGKHEGASSPQPAATLQMALSSSCAAASSTCSLVPPIESLLTPAVTAHFLHLFPASSLVHVQSLLPSASSPPSFTFPVYLLSHRQPSRRPEQHILACSSQGGVPLRGVQRCLLQGLRCADVVLAVVDLQLTVTCLRLRDGIAPLTKHRQRKAARAPKSAAAASTPLPAPPATFAAVDGMEEREAEEEEEQGEDEKG